MYNVYVPKFENRDFYIEILFGAKTCVVVYGFAYLTGAGHTYYCRKTGTKDVARGEGKRGKPGKRLKRNYFESNSFRFFFCRKRGSVVSFFVRQTENDWDALGRYILINTAT